MALLCKNVRPASNRATSRGPWWDLRTARIIVSSVKGYYKLIPFEGIEYLTSYKNPHTGTGTVNQLLGLNDKGIAVGFYTDGNGINHAYKLNQNTKKFSPIVPPGGNNAIAAGINNNGDVVGFYVDSAGNTDGFLAS